MKIYECSVCGFIYDEAMGLPDEGIAPGTLWENIPDDWVCPLCGATKSEFFMHGEEEKNSNEEKNMTLEENAEDFKELSPLEISILCSNLARGCEKQYKLEEATIFNNLSEYFKKASKKEIDPSFDKLIDLVEKDLNINFKTSYEIASKENDRGALRSLVWSEKVTKILKSILNRYQKEGTEFTDHTGVYVCTICGFIYIGDTLPEVCPVCKVPNWKFEQIEGGNIND